MESIEQFCAQETENDMYTPLSNRFLYQFLQQKNIRAFQLLLELERPRQNFNINHVYGDPHYGSLLDIACQDIHYFDFIPLLIKYGAKINLVNEIHGKAPLHFAAELPDTKTLQYLLNIAYIDVNIVDNTGGTALHLACQLGKLEHVKFLLHHKKLRVNAFNEKTQTPITLAIMNKSKEIICELLKHKDIDIDSVETSPKHSVRKVIIDRFPELALNLPEPREKNGDDEISKVSKLFLYLRQRNLESFKELLKEDPTLVNSGLGDYTFFQYACEYGLYDFVDLLLTSGADANRTCATNDTTGFVSACERGYHRIVKRLVGICSISFSSTDGGTVLHTIIQHSTSKYAPFMCLPEVERDYVTCLKIVLEKESSNRLNINKRNVKGRTALHYAAKVGNQSLIFLLLDFGADIRTKNNFGKTPLAYISPEILEAYLDRCVCTNGMLPVDDDYEVHFLYNFLLPTKSSKKSTYSMLNNDEEVGGNETAPVSDTDPLLYMSDSAEHRHLLIHPVITSFIHFKWNSIQWFFYCNLAFYLTFWSLLTAYIIFFYNIGDDNVLYRTQNTTCKLNNTLVQDHCTNCILLQNNSTNFKLLPNANFTLLKNDNNFTLLQNNSAKFPLLQNINLNCILLRNNFNNSILLQKDSINCTLRQNSSTDFTLPQNAHCTLLQNHSTNFLLLQNRSTNCVFIQNSSDFTLLQNNDNSCTLLQNYSTGYTACDILRYVGYILPCLLTILLVMLILREIFEMYVSPLRYITSIENWMEITLIIVTGLILHRDQEYIPRNQLSAVGILLSWGEFVLLTGRHPWLCTKIEMFRTVTRNFIEFFSWYFILILAFALSFYSLFKDAMKDESKSADTCKIANKEYTPAIRENKFLYPGRSIFKTLVMLTGEFEAGEIPFDSNYGIGYLLFVLFIFLIAIVLFNLLNGLAVNDTQAIRNDAELVGIVSHAEFISYIETILQRDHDWFRLPDFFSKTNRFIACIFSELRVLLPKPIRKISVLPNQENAVKQAPSCEFTLCFAKRRHFMMKKSIVQAAKEVLKKRNEMLENDKRVDECGQRVQRELEKLRQEIFDLVNRQSRKFTRTHTD